MEEDGTVVLAYFLPLPDVLDGLDHDVILHVVPDDAGVAGVVEQGQGGVDPGTDEDGLGALLACLGDHLELSDLVGVELEQLQEVHQQIPDEELVLSERLPGSVGEISLALEAAQHEDREHRPVENIPHLSLLVVVHEVVVVLVVPGDVGLLLLLGLPAGLVVGLEEMLVLLEPVQGLLCDRPVGQVADDAHTRGDEEVHHLALVAVVGGEGHLPTLETAEHHLAHKY